MGSCPLTSRARLQGYSPPSLRALPFRYPRGPYAPLGSNGQKRDPEVSRVSVYCRGWGSPAGPSLNRVSPDGAEWGVAGLDRVGQWALDGTLGRSWVLLPDCRWGASD